MARRKRTDWSLVCPFLNQSDDFALGVEFGLLYAELSRRAANGETRIEGYFSRANQENVLLLMNRSGWAVRELEPHDDCWFWLAAER